MNIEEAKEILDRIDIKFFLSGMIEQSNYIVDKADEVNTAIYTVLNELDKKDKVIDMMAEYIDKAYFDKERIEKWFKKNILPKDDFDLVDYKERYIRYPIIKEYFYNKVEIPEKK